MKELLTPRGYISWTQISMWLQSPKRYIDHYVYGGSNISNRRMDFGSKTAEALENDTIGDDNLMNLLVAILPKYEKSEHEMSVPFKSKSGMITLLGKLDSFSPKSLSIREYKTGMIPWTQARANKHKQLDHYTAMVWLKHRKMPKHIHLDWAETEMKNNEVCLTGNIKSFEIIKSVGDILEYLAIVVKVAKEINEMYKLELKKLT